MNEISAKICLTPGFYYDKDTNAAKTYKKKIMLFMVNTCHRNRVMFGGIEKGSCIISRRRRLASRLI